MPGGKASRDKGNRRERQVVEWLNSIGCTAQRVPLSGAAGGAFQHDVRFTLPNGDPWVAEVKGRKQFKTLAQWMPHDRDGNAISNGLLVLVPDRAGAMIVLSEASFAFLLKAASRYNPAHDDTSETSAERIVVDGGKVGDSQCDGSHHSTVGHVGGQCGNTVDQGF